MRGNILVFIVLLYRFSILAGTAYLVQEFNWSPWWFLLCVISWITLEKDDMK